MLLGPSVVTKPKTRTKHKDIARTTLGTTGALSLVREVVVACARDLCACFLSAYWLSLTNASTLCAVLVR